MGIFDNPRAFDPMFTDIVHVVAGRTSRSIDASFRACVHPIVFDDPFNSDGNLQSERQRFSVLIAKHGNAAWNEAALGSKPRIGDKIYFKSGLTAAVTKVSAIVDDWYELEAKEC